MTRGSTAPSVMASAIKSGGKQMPSITVASGETLRLNKPLSPSDTVTIEPGGLLIANRLSFITSAGDIVVVNPPGGIGVPPASGPTAGALEIKHVAPLVHTDLSFASLVLDFADGTSTTLPTFGTSPLGNIHPVQVSGSGDFF